MRTKRLGFLEYEDARGFLLAVDVLVRSPIDTLARFPEGWQIPSLINLTFLSIEMSMKCHIRNAGGKVPMKHGVDELWGALQAVQGGAERTHFVRTRYDAEMNALEQKLPTTNRHYLTFERLASFLAQRTFLEWRYVGESLEQKVANAKPMSFPFMNVYVLAALLLFERAYEWNDDFFMRRFLRRKYPHFPYWIRIEKDDNSDSGIRWSVEDRALGLLIRPGLPDT